jgi:hypothetical protein
MNTKEKLFIEIDALIERLSELRKKGLYDRYYKTLNCIKELKEIYNDLK